MRPIRTGISKARLLAVLAPLALAGCVPGAYVQDYPQDGYYSGSGGSYYRGPYSNYYSNYYGYPGYYGSGYYYRPRVVYYDHDHDDRDCRHESHRDRRQYDDRDRHDRGRYRDERDDRDDRDTDRAAPAPHRLPPTGTAPLRRTPRVAPPPASSRPQASAPPPKAAAGKSPDVKSEVEPERDTKRYPGDRRR